MNRRLPVTLVGGFLGAGKTSLLHHIISEHRGGHLALLVDHPGTLNPDAQALRGLCGAMRRTHDAVLAIPAVDETTQLEWIAARLREFSESGRYERVLVEVAGTSNAARFAEHFDPASDGPQSFAPWAELEQIVCVVDALDYLRTGRGPATGKGLWDFVNEQIAGATLVVLNKCDLLDEQELDLCRRMLQTLHGGALRIIETAYGEVPPETWSQPATAAQLLAAIQREPAYLASSSAPTELKPPPPALACAIYRAYHPFHPQRFWDWFDGEQPALWRLKGLVWLATRHLLVGGVSRTRWQNACGAAGVWWDALPREEWPEEPAALARMQETWHEPYGDRRQELVLIGEANQVSHTMRAQLDACLLTADEFARGPEAWRALPDPFPSWDLGED